MATNDLPARECAINTAALATMGTDSTWDARLTEYLRRRALQQAVCDFGFLSKANEEHSYQIYRVEAAFGSGWRDDPRAEALTEPTSKAADAAQKRWDAEYCEPFWQAGRDLVLTPAPSLAAALFKFQIIRDDEVWNDSRMERDCVEIIAEDMARPRRPNPIEDPVTRYWTAFDAYNSGCLTEGEYDAVLTELDAWAPPTFHDFVRKFEAIFIDGGKPSDEREDMLTQQAIALLGGARAGREA